MTNKKFQGLIWNFYRKNKRNLPWRTPILKPQGKNKILDPYKILVSEIMLQQTQADRVIPKYKSWIKKFPSFKKLSLASLKDVLKEWKGLGYNRRALALKHLAEKVVEEHSSTLPDTYEELLKLPGIGPYTAGAVLAFAFNKPVPIVETNIRTVFIHHFFSKDKKHIHDKEILKLVFKTLDKKNPREWFWALMDYGNYLKKTFGNNTKQSRHYIKQTRFFGSNRHIRSLMLHYITTAPAPEAKIIKYIQTKNTEATSEQILKNIIDLENEGFIKRRNGLYDIV